MDTEITIHEATLDDVQEILRQRRGMYEDMNYTDQAALSVMVNLCRPYLLDAMADGSFRAWMACMGDCIVGGGAIVIVRWPSHPNDRQCRRATILNVYTDREYRRQGIARQLMHTMIAWCKREGFASVTLHASKDGGPLYESLGFEPSNEMKLKL
ncbi:MAG: GNAT family N-acetyltransferase [Acidobacteriia bacterium]|nr:GNAT family N-acetyltransferase [Terriglobia bacterium]